MTKRQMRIWNRRRRELIDVAKELSKEPVLSLIAQKINELVEIVDAMNAEDAS